MKTVLLDCVKKEKPNAAALGAYNTIAAVTTAKIKPHELLQNYLNGRSEESKKELVNFIDKIPKSMLDDLIIEYEKRSRRGINQDYANIVPIERQKIQLENTKHFVQLLKASRRKRK